MLFYKKRSITTLIFLINLFRNVIGTEVAGCGGFIKSDTPIPFSKVGVKLINKQGGIKEQTECSPSNGYYFIPIYDKGEYVLKVTPPVGWSFERTHFDLNFDGQTDVCSQGDLNFRFKGFGIIGKVSLAGSTSAASKGVDVELRSIDGSDVRRTETDINGAFSFTPIVPNKYIVRASHDKWRFSKSEYTVEVDSGNTELPFDALVLSGFHVLGRIESNDQLPDDIGVAIFKQERQNLPQNCRRYGHTGQKVGNENYDFNAGCFVQTNKVGEYSFLDITPGKYLLLPVVENRNLKLNIKPEYLEIEVGKDTFISEDAFKITGFSVSGLVRSSAGGSAVSKALLKLNNQVVAETDSQGIYILENINSGSYRFQVEAANLKFDEQLIDINVDTYRLPDLIASAYMVCGKVISSKSHVVGITKHGSTFHTTSSTKAETNEWCVYLPNGKYSVEVVTSDSDRNSGMQFFPLRQNIEVKSAPILAGVTFSQLRATLAGEVKCLPDAPSECSGAAVTLHTLNSIGEVTGITQSTRAIDGIYSFHDILPGPFEITVLQPGLCFETTRIALNVASVAESIQPFVHRGYEVSIISSHRAIMKYWFVHTGDHAAGATETVKLPSGVNTLCVPKYGVYNFKLEGCHLYDGNLPNTFSTLDRRSPTIINAVAHKIGIRILAPDAQISSLRLAIASASLEPKLFTPLPEAHKVDGRFSFRYDTHVKPQESIVVTPQSDALLFSPESKEIVGTNECIDIAFNFIASRGLILKGRVLPAIAAVNITLSFPENVDLKPKTTMTSSNGEFKFAPISENLVFKLVAEKESYVFSSYNATTASFIAHKLCEVKVNVWDGAGRNLSGVLLSLSGAESYRKNIMTGKDGSINFHSLLPSQYFLRPMMKEYMFTPASKMINVADGRTVQIDIVGTRVAYSILGKVTSLNGDPYAQVNIEAVADERCMHHQEEATTEANGNYRLRGLQPGCTYTIRPKDIGHLAANIERSIPAFHIATISDDDIYNIDLIAISPIAFVDVIARVTASHNDHYKTLRIVLHRKGSTEAPVHTQRIEAPLNSRTRYNPGTMVFLPRMPLDGRTYVITLSSTMSDKMYAYAQPSIEFVTNTSSIFVEMEFRPEVRAHETDLNQNSISALVLIALVAIAFFKQNIAIDFLNFTWTRLNGIVQDVLQRQKTRKDTRRTEPINYKEIEHMAEQINAVKKKKPKKI